MGHVDRKVRVIAALVAVIAVIFLMSVTAERREQVSFPEIIATEVAAPVQRLVAGAADTIGEYATVVLRYGRLKDELGQVRTELERLDQLQREVDLLATENQRLRSLLGLEQAVYASEGAGGSVVGAAEVVARNPDNWFDQVVLNKGRADGISVDMVAVVAPKALVGRVVRVTPSTATVMLLSNPESGVGGLVQATGDAGVVVGRPGEPDRLEMHFYSRTAKPEPGQFVVTSGLGEKYPPGFMIGTIRQVRRDDSSAMVYAEVVPFADLARLDAVLIMSGRE